MYDRPWKGKYIFILDLKPEVAFQPNGSCICGIENNKIIFWEKNGLRHGEF
jgi:hypothetical protein